MPERETLVLDGVDIERGGRMLLQNVTLRLCDGVVAIVGANGVGKTSLLRAIGGALPPQAGTIALAGVDVRAMSPRERARAIALVESAEPAGATLTVADAVAAARFPYHRWWEWDATPDDEQAIDDALQRTGTTALRARELGTLSAGERQRVSLARAFVRDARLLLLDEPTASLDGETEADVLEAVRQLLNGRTAVIVAHRPALAALADRVVELPAPVEMVS